MISICFYDNSVALHSKLKFKIRQKQKGRENDLLFFSRQFNFADKPDSWPFMHLIPSNGYPTTMFIQVSV